MSHRYAGTGHRHLPEMGLAIGAHRQRLVWRFAEALAKLYGDTPEVDEAVLTFPTRTTFRSQFPVQGVR